MTLKSTASADSESAGDRPAVWVDTFRSGLLAALGHDLRLRVERFEIVLEQGKLTAELDLSSLRVLGAMSHGRKGSAGQLDASVPSARDREEIERAIHGILNTTRFARATFAGRATPRAGSGFVIEGELQLHGGTQPLSVLVSRDPRWLRAQVELVPTRFGIAPYRALGGALKLEDRIAITIELPVASVTPDLAALSDIATAKARWHSA